MTGEPTEVGARALVGSHKVVRVAHEKGTDAIGQEEALVGVQRDRVGSFDAAQSMSAALRESEETTVGSIDVEPGSHAGGQVGQLFERVDAARVRGACHAHHQEWPMAVRHVCFQQVSEGARVHAPGRVRAHPADGRRGDPHQLRCLRDRVVDALRDVHGEAVFGRRAGGGTRPGPRRHDGRLVGQRAPGEQQAAGAPWEAQHVRHPAQHALLHGDHGRRLEGGAREGVRAGCQERGDGPGLQRAVGDEGEDAVGRLVPAGRSEADELVEDVRWDCPGLRWWSPGQVDESSIGGGMDRACGPDSSQPLERPDGVHGQSASLVGIQSEGLAGLHVAHAVTLSGGPDRSRCAPTRPSGSHGASGVCDDVASCGIALATLDMGGRPATHPNEGRPVDAAQEETT